MSAARKPAARRTASARRGVHAPTRTAPRPVDVVVITVSDTRRGAEDTSGALADWWVPQATSGSAGDRSVVDFTSNAVLTSEACSTRRRYRASASSRARRSMTSSSMSTSPITTSRSP